MSGHGLRGRYRGFYLDRDNSWLFGVCAGIADRFRVDITMVRLITVLAGVFMTLTTVVVYGLAAWLLQERPITRPDDASERAFWREHSRNRSY